MRLNSELQANTKLRILRKSQKSYIPPPPLTILTSSYLFINFFIPWQKQASILNNILNGARKHFVVNNSTKRE